MVSTAWVRISKSMIYATFLMVPTMIVRILRIILMLVMIVVSIVMHRAKSVIFFVEITVVLFVIITVVILVITTVTIFVVVIIATMMVIMVIIRVTITVGIVARALTMMVTMVIITRMVTVVIIVIVIWMVIRAATTTAARIGIKIVNSWLFMIMVLVSSIEVHIKSLVNFMFDLVVNGMSVLWFHLEDQVTTTCKNILWVEHASVRLKSTRSFVPFTTVKRIEVVAPVELKLIVFLVIGENLDIVV